MTKTKGRGVHVILNSLTGELFEASVRCLGEEGRFLELGKVEFYNRTLLDSYIFLKNCSFHGILFDKIFNSSMQLKKSVYQLVLDGKYRKNSCT